MQIFEITNAEQLWEWLSDNHSFGQSIHLVTWKANHPDKYVGREEVLDALIAHGWIDGRRFVVDGNRTAQLITARQQQAWSKSYKDRVARLRSEGRMHPAGEERVAEGQASGLWNFFDDVDALMVPEDLAVVLDVCLWDELAPSYRRNVLRWIKLAKSQKTRAARIAMTEEATRNGVRLKQM
jgi:uncharacterized protein YdeI (YjbR/CyaY-like superfamily)